MKYLKLKVDEKFPLDHYSKISHITFVYFGEIKVDELYLSLIIGSIKPFILRKIRSDKFGKNKDIPVVVYQVEDKNESDKIHYSRLQILQTYNILDINYSNWTPHISNVDYDKAPEFLHVNGIQSNDEIFECQL